MAFMRCRACAFDNCRACNGYVAKEGIIQRKMECSCAKRGHNFFEEGPCWYCSINEHGRCKKQGCFCPTCKNGGPKKEWSPGQQKVCKPCTKRKHKQCEKGSCTCMKEWNCGGNR